MSARCKNCSSKNTVRYAAILAVLLMVFSGMCIMPASDDSSAAEVNTADTSSIKVNVVYTAGGSPSGISSTYNDTTTPADRTVTYYGNVISTEYNPQVWDYGAKSGGSYWYKINSYIKGSTYVYTGWAYGTAISGSTVTYTSTYDPGDVLVYSGGAWHIGGETGATVATKEVDGVTTIYIKATWGKLANYSSGSSDITNFSKSGTKYTNIYEVTENNKDFTTNTYSNLKSNVTIRSDSLTSLRTIQYKNITLNGEIILDHVILDMYAVSSSHGAKGSGIFANGKTLIIGEGVTTKFTKGSNSSQDSYSQGDLYGGGTSSVTSTKLIVHSGMFSNIVGGSKAAVSGNCVTILKNVTVMDTLIGSGIANVSGTAYVYAVGLKMYGDCYEEDMYDDGLLNGSYAGFKGGNNVTIQAYESSIFTGGSNDNSVANTKIYLSGDSNVWDLQAGGRRESSKVTGTAQVEVSGRATVKHALCGSITDGAKNNTNYQCVKKVILSVMGESKVANVFGAGYDTFYEATAASMYGSGTTITININGGTVGYVYGGGYRGTIGLSNNPIDSISINIRGGTILGDVFGGGRGGVDKTCHNPTTGENTWSDSYKDYTGHSEVYAKSVVVTVSGGTINGSVYGGGESVPFITGYNCGSSTKTYTRTDVAMIKITSASVSDNGVYVKMTGGIVKGSVYGGGKGIDATTSYVPYIITIRDSGIYNMPWVYGNNNSNYMDTSKNYLTYARIYGDIGVTVSGGTVEGSVYGGGAFGNINDSSNSGHTVSVTINSTVQNDVFGGGKGSSTSTSLGQMYVTSTSVNILSNGEVQNNVYGGGAYGIVSGNTSVEIAGVVGKSSSAGPASECGNVYGGGQGTSSGTQYTIGQVNSVTKLTVKSTATVYGSVYGGGAYGNVTGTGTLPVAVESGGIVYGSVYGGGFGLSTSTNLGKISGSVTVSIAGTVEGNVYGGGAFGQVAGSTSVEISGTVGKSTSSGADAAYGHVYGAGQGTSTGTNYAIGQVGSVSKVNINSGATVYGNVYGGGAYGKVASGGIDVKIYGTVYGNVYGGGQGTPTYSVNFGYVPSNTSVTVYKTNGNVKGRVYGGGAYGVVNGTTAVTVYGTVGNGVVGGGYGIENQVANKTSSVVISGATVTGNIFGGAENGKVDGNSSVTMTSSAVAGRIYGGGLGFLGVESVSGNSSVEINSGTVTITRTANDSENGAVFGAAQNGIVKGTSAVILNGTADITINGDVYGAGLGNNDGTTAYSSVVSTSTVLVKGSTTINGTVYGGSAKGLVGGKSTVTVENGSIDGDIYAAGYGQLGIISNSAGSEVELRGGTYGSSTTVYGGAAYGIVVGNTAVDIYEVTLSGAVYGGGLGERDYESVRGTCYVALNDPTSVVGALYGGAAYGYVSATDVTINNGVVNGQVYGAGLGDNNGTTAYPSVNGNVVLRIATGTIRGDVYGGSALGLVTGNITMTISGGTYGGTIFCGGKGATGIISVYGTRSIHISGNVVIAGSVYGGSANGNDQNPGNVSNTSHAYIFIQSGEIQGSVFGGGFKGKTFGNTNIFIGVYSLTVGSEHSVFTAHATNTQKTITIAESIYLGGDVGVIIGNAKAYDSSNPMVQGNGYLYLAEADDVETSNITFGGSIMGSGNSCVTKGDTFIVLRGYHCLTESEGIHRATSVIIDNCTLTLNGRATVDTVSVVNDASYSLFDIKLLIIKDGSILYLNGPMEKVAEYESQNSNGDATTSTSPFNKVVIGDGNSFIIRSVSDSSGSTVITYGKVTGYTILSANGNNSNFGAYAIGSPLSSGGFVIYRSGVFANADYSDLTADCRCWYIKGTITDELSLTVSSTTTDQAIVTIPMLQIGSTYRYTGGTFINASALGDFKLVTGKDVYSLNEFSVRFGYGVTTTDSLITFGGNNGTYLIDDYSSVDPVLGKLEGEVSDKSRNPNMYILVAGNFDANQYIGYILININEVREITVEGEKTYIIVNTIQCKVHIYSESSFDSTINLNLSVGSVRGEGSSDITIPAGMAGQSVIVESVNAVAGSSNLTKFFVQSEKNKNNTLGWTDHLEEAEFYTNGSSSAVKVGTLQGGYVASLNIRFSGFTGSTDNEYYDMVIKVYDGDSVSLTINVRITICKVPDVHISFEISEGTVLTYTYAYGTVLNPADCPPTENNFVGWYTDQKCNNPFSYSTPLTKDITLYALYMYCVTLDYMDGTYSTVYVSMNHGVIGPIVVSERDGYVFDAWYTETDFVYKWNTEDAIVEDDMTLYAKWIGWTVKVEFYYNTGSDNVQHHIDLGTDAQGLTSYDLISFGSNYSNSSSFNVGSSTASYNLLDWAQKRLTDPDINVKLVFIYWVYLDDLANATSKNAAVYSDVKLTDTSKLEKNTDGTYKKDSNGYYSVCLTAYLSDLAAKVTMDSKVYDGSGTSLDQVVVDSPASFLIYPSNSKDDQRDNNRYLMTIEMNGATRPGYSLKGWHIEGSDGDKLISGTANYLYPAGSVISLAITKTTGEDYPYIATYSVGSSVKQVIKITEDEYKQLTGVGDMYVINFIGEWEHIVYTVSIADAANGTIYALYKGSDGTYQRVSTINLYYGEQIEVMFEASNGYEFYKWSCIGEGSFKQMESSQTVFVVLGDATISAYVVGPQIIKVYVDYYTGSDKLPESFPVLYIGEDGGNETIFTFTARQYGDATSTGYTVEYIGTANLEKHHLYLRGSSVDVPYDTGIEIDSSTDFNSYYITVGTELHKQAFASSLDGLTTFIMDGVTYVVTDQYEFKVRAESIVEGADVVSEDGIVVTLPATVTNNGNKYTVTTLGKNLLANLTGVKKVDLGTKTIYRQGYIAVIDNQIQKTVVDGVPTLVGVKYVTDYIFYYYGNNTNTNVQIQLEAGFYQYEDSNHVVFTDTSGVAITSNNKESDPYELTPWSAGSKYTLNGYIGQVKYHITVKYETPTSTVESGISIELEYGDLILTELNKHLPGSDAGYTLYAWYINEKLVDSTSVCEYGETSLTAIGKCVMNSGQTLNIVVNTQKTDGTYDFAPAVNVPLNGGVSKYQILSMSGFSPVVISNSGLVYKITNADVTVDGVTYTILDSILTVSGATNGSTVTINLKRETVSVIVTDKTHAAEGVEVMYGAYLSVVLPDMTDTVVYKEWNVKGLENKVVDGSVQITLTDLNNYQAGKSLTISPKEETRLYDVTVLTMRGDLSKTGDTSTARVKVVQVPYNTSIASNGKSVTVGTGDDAKTVTLDDSGITEYTFDKWDLTVSSVKKDLTVTAVWNVEGYKLSITYLDNNVTVTGTNAYSPIEFTKKTDSAGHTVIESSSELAYDSLITLSIKFKSLYTLDTSQAVYEVNGQRVVMSPSKQNSMQEYSLQFFLSGETDISFGSKWAGNHLYFYVQNENGSYVLIDSMSQIVSSYSTVSSLRVSEYEAYSSLLKAGYYFDGWYTDESCTTLPYVQTVNNELYYKIQVFNTDVKLYARYLQPVSVNVDTIYDGETHTAKADVISTSVNLVKTTVYGTDPGTETSPSVTNCTDEFNHQNVAYTVTFSKKYTDGIDTIYTTGQSVGLSGSVSLDLAKRVLYVIAASMTVETSEDVGSGYQDYTALGLMGADKVILEYELTGSNVESGVITGKGVATNTIKTHSIVSASDDSIDRAGNYTATWVDGHVTVLGQGSSSVIIGTT